ncbi:tectonic-1 isoform X2 [Mastacembelus armatus]|uniref:tectonic-1 isoform X2 n=1 Tax=Mastacembelus armatus TaxID=205130 RepID=UPI000E4568F5|nr:tectonic-1 isoform X2 [Mastacembelus armatus]
MAMCAVSPRSFLNIFCLFLQLFTVVNTEENIRNYPSTAFGDTNVTNNTTDTYTITKPTEFEWTTSHTNIEEPAEPLPASGRLFPPVLNVDSMCPCDEHRDVCDINCCCDKDCNEEVALFTDCSVRTVSGNKQLCSYDVASYTLGRTTDGYSELQSSVRKEISYDIFCIQSQYRVEGLSHLTPALPTDTNFDSLFKQFTSFIFGLEENSGKTSAVDLQTSPEYKYGDLLVTAQESGQRGVFRLPAPGVTADCVDTNPAAFLKDQSNTCSRRVVLNQACSTLPAFSMDTYTNIRLFAGKNNDAAVAPEVLSVILQSIDGTLTELTISGGENLSPTLLNPDLCTNVVLKVTYVMKYNPAGEIVKVAVSLVLGFVREAELPLKQDFQIAFVQDGEDMAVRYSGNPGYVVGLPLVSGTKTADGIIRSINLRDSLSLLNSAGDQDCLQGPHQRSPVLFGLDLVSGCKLRLEDTSNCSLVSQMLLDILRGPNYPQYVASFGNSPLENALDWVQIKTNFIPGTAQSCSIPLSLHLEIEWTKYGSLVNAQPQIGSIKEVIQTNTTSLSLLSGGSNILSIRSSVAFIPVSANALPGFRAIPTINAKLPIDFFFPFV